MAKSEIKFEKKMNKKELALFIDESLNADPVIIKYRRSGWLVSLPDDIKLKVKGKSEDGEGSLSFTVHWGEDNKKDKKDKESKKDKKDKGSKKDKKDKESKKTVKIEEKKHKKATKKSEEWKPTDEDIKRGKETYEKDGWKGLMKAFGTRRGKVIKDMVAPKKAKIEKKPKVKKVSVKEDKEKKKAAKEAEKAAKK